MKNQNAEKKRNQVNIQPADKIPVPRLSDDAFYLISLAVLLKKSVTTETLRKYVSPGDTYAASRA